MEPNENENCAVRWQQHADGRLNDIRLMLAPDRDDVELVGSVLQIGDAEVTLTATELDAYRDDNGDIDLNELVNDQFEDLAEQRCEAFYEYGLEFSYQNGDENQAGYWWFLISWGGPSEELRFFTDQGGIVYKVEFWFLDWYDGHGQALEGEQLETAMLAWDALTGGETPEVPED